MKSMIIGVVGPCAAGKSTLTRELKARGYLARHIAQEHSYVPDMWLRLTNPDVLVYLAVSYPLTVQRRKLDWTLEEYAEQIHRLRHARQYANITIDTDPLSASEVLDRVIEYINSMNNSYG